MPQKRNLQIFGMVVVVTVILGLAFSIPDRPNNLTQQPTFYLGVTYCGNSVTEAKQLIDKVKDYTNLFVLQTSLWSSQKINEVCTYATSTGMNFIVYFGNQHSEACNDWLNTISPALQQKCLGVYFGDELGGKMLDDDAWFLNQDMPLSGVLNKYSNGTFSAYLPDVGSQVLFQKDGSIVLWEFLPPQPGDNGSTCQYITYFPNGSIICEIQPYGGPRVTIENFTAKPLSLPEIWNQRPFQTYDETAERFIQTENNSFSTWHGDRLNVTSFTSDYALYWYDYKGGYDVVLAQVGWNQTVAQDIALVRGAAYMQNKSWGGIITWKYTQPPYLDNGEAIYNQMLTLYESGAKYVVVFNYAEDMIGAYGTLQDQHFDALNRFWKDIVQNPEIKQGSKFAEAVLVLPSNYGWGMRNPQDNIWGLWSADDISDQIWMQLQNKLAQYGSKLDVIYDDPAYPIAEKYGQIFYWNQTS
jgi:hypothetical protein